MYTLNLELEHTEEMDDICSYNREQLAHDLEVRQIVKKWEGRLEEHKQLLHNELMNSLERGWTLQ